eukprot:scaffold1.g5665.t1
MWKLSNIGMRDASLPDNLRGDHTYLLAYATAKNACNPKNVGLPPLKDGTEGVLGDDVRLDLGPCMLKATQSGSLVDSTYRATVLLTYGMVNRGDETRQLNICHVVPIFEFESTKPFHLPVLAFVLSGGKRNSVRVLKPAAPAAAASILPPPLKLRDRKLKLRDRELELQKERNRELELLAQLHGLQRAGGGSTAALVQGSAAALEAANRGFRSFGHQLVDFIAGYYETLEARPVSAAPTPGALRAALPAAAPEAPEAFEAVLCDVKRLITPDLTHWQHPLFMAYFPSNASFPGMLADLLSTGYGCLGFSWVASPAVVELERACLDWLAALLGLPDALWRGAPHGGAVVQASASEATLVSLLGARARVMAGRPPSDALRLVAYASDQAHSSIMKACMVAGCRCRVLPTSVADEYAFSPVALEAAVAADARDGLLPFFVNATIGTTSSCAVDPVRQIGEVARRHGLWLSVDAAWAGVFGLLAEQRARHMGGLELTDVYITNPHKAEYLQNPLSAAMPDLKDVEVPLGHRFQRVALKLWFMMRLYGAGALRELMAHRLRLQRRFEALLAADPRFELIPGAPPRFGLVCFRLRGSDELNERLLHAINGTGRLFLVHTVLGGAYVLRAALGGTHQQGRHIDAAWATIAAAASEVLAAGTPCGVGVGEPRAPAASAASDGGSPGQWHAPATEDGGCSTGSQPSPIGVGGNAPADAGAISRDCSCGHCARSPGSGALAIAAGGGGPHELGS